MQLENVAISIAAVHDLLVRERQDAAAQLLFGLEVHCSTDVRFALATLQSVEPDNDEIRDAIVWAIAACVGYGTSRPRALAAA